MSSYQAPAHGSSSGSTAPIGSLANTQADPRLNADQPELPPLGGHAVPDGISAGTEKPSLQKPSPSPSPPHAANSFPTSPVLPSTTANSAQTLHFVGFPHQVPLITTMSHEPVYFCGPNFDPKTETWSTYHTLPRNSRLDFGDQHLRTIVADKDNAKIEAALRKAAVFGDAAGKIYLRWTIVDEDTTEARNECMTLSGFWLGKYAFVTSAHWLEKVKESNFERGIIEELQNPVRSQVIISDRDWSPKIAQNLDHHAYLLDFDANSDIAIFCLRKAGGHDRCVLTLDQLGLASSDDSAFPVWTVAYSVQDSNIEDDFGVEFRSKESKLREARDTKIMLKKPKSVFEYMTYGYFESLVATVKGSYIIGKIRPNNASKSNHAHQSSTPSESDVFGESDVFDMADKIPKFSDLFIPNQKALAVGRVLSRKDQSELLQLPTPQGQQDQGEAPAYSESRVHTISGYFGCSGAMIATFDETEKPIVVGIFNGGDERPMNVFTAFTEAGLRWIADTVAASDRVSQGPTASVLDATTSI